MFSSGTLEELLGLGPEPFPCKAGAWLIYDRPNKVRPPIFQSSYRLRYDRQVARVQSDMLGSNSSCLFL